MGRTPKAKKVAVRPSAENRRRFVEHARAAREMAEKVYSNDTAFPIHAIWDKVVQELAAKYEIQMPDSISHPGLTTTNPTGFLLDLDLEVQAAKIVHDTDAERILSLDADWQSKAGSYISHIREAVSRADMREALRERILSRLNALQVEIDRNRTRMESVTEVLLSLTEAVGKGAKNLTPALRLFERLAGALSGARSTRLGYETHEPLAAPESFGLIEDASANSALDE
jgi:hypothetical protein